VHKRQHGTHNKNPAPRIILLTNLSDPPGKPRKWTPLLDELLALERLREHPVPRRDVVRRDRTAPPAGDLERQRLAVEVGVALPVLAPVPAHRDPPGPRALHLHGGHLAVRSHVGDQHLEEVGAAGDREPHAAGPVTAHPASPPFTSKVRFGCSCRVV
jgi:hypothetical protein